MKSFLIGLTVLCFHTAAAYAQQSPPPPGAYPPGYGPPPGYVAPSPYGYGPPPPAAAPPHSYYNYYYPPPAPPPPPRRVTDRPFTIGLGIGFGGLVFPDQVSGARDSKGGFAYTGHLGFGLAPRLILMWDVEGAIVESGPAFYSQTAHLAALQLFLTDRLFVKGGFGLARVNRDDVFTDWGGAGMGGIGYELVQGWNWSFDIEATVTSARYTDQVWTNWSLVNFAINFF
jgi:hypothetical protein